MGQIVKEKTVLHHSKKLKLNYTQKLLIFERMQEKFLPIGFSLGKNAFIIELASTHCIYHRVGIGQY